MILWFCICKMLRYSLAGLQGISQKCAQVCCLPLPSPTIPHAGHPANSFNLQCVYQFWKIMLTLFISSFLSLYFSLISFKLTLKSILRTFSHCFLSFFHLLPFFVLLPRKYFWLHLLILKLISLQVFFFYFPRAFFWFLVIYFNT